MDAGSAQAASRLLKHFELDVHKFKPPLWNRLSHIDAEEARPWSDLQDARCAGQLKMTDESLR